jgi:hypothetical protein
MFGFIKSLFGSRNKSDNSMVPQKSKDAYFLDQDAASTLGDVDYMRATRSIKRTYAKTVDSPTEKATIKRVSSMNGKVYEEGESLPKPAFQAPTQSTQTFSTPTPSFSAPTPAPTQPKADDAAQRRKSDSSMDMFRNMAKDIRK